MQKLCCVRTRQQFSASLDYFVTSSPPYLHQFSTIFGGNCIRLQVSSFDSQANQSNQSSIHRELLMPSPEVIDLTLSDDEIQPDPIRSDQATSTPTRATNHFRTSSLTPPTSGINRTRRILPVIMVLLQPLNKLKIISHSNLSSTTLTLDKHSSTASTTNTGLATQRVLGGDVHQHIHSKRFCHKRVCED